MTETAPPRRLDYVPLDDLTDALVNPKQHDDALIEASIGRFGFLEIPVLDERTGRLVAGHGRRDQLRALRDRGEAPPDGVLTDAEGRWLVPTVRGWASRSDDEAHAAGIAINRGAEAGGWELPVLYDLLSTFAEADEGLVGLGFDPYELDDIVRGLGRTAEAFDPKEHWGGDGTHGTLTIEGQQDRYAENGIRSLILDYQLAEFDELTETATHLRRHRGLESNAELVAALLREAAAHELPSE